jgi:hypothetical protein
MAYKRANSNSFAEYQLGEGFKAAVTGQGDARFGESIVDVSKLAEKGAGIFPAGLNGLKGYEGYPQSYAGYEEYGNIEQISEMAQEGAGLGSIEEISEMAQEGAGLGSIEEISEMAQEGAGLGSIEEISEMAQEGAGLGSIEDDAFAGIGTFGGYEFGEDMNKISTIAKESALEDKIGEDEFDGYDGLLADGYGSLEGGPMESFHTYFNRASMAKTETALIRSLAKAVKSVPNDTPLSVRKEYYQMAMELLKRLKKTKLSYIDTKNVEIQSNLGWLINPSLPKTGGFDAMVKKAVGVVGGKLAKGDKEDIKRKKLFDIGERLKRNLQKTGQLAGFDGTGTMKYVGFGLLGLLLAAGIWYFVKKKETPVAARKRKRKSRKKKK